jgi:ribosomal protein S6--L-glutamate ligase
MHLTVLSRSAGIFTTRRIVEAARARGHVARVVDPLQVEMRLGREGPGVFHRGGPFPATDVVVPRIAPSVSQYGLAVVNHLQLLGIPVLNGAPAIGLARNKMRVLQMLSASGIRVPRTVMASEPSGLREMVRHVGGLPVLVKLLRGNERTGAIVCETRQALESALEAILRLGQNTVVQQYVKGKRGGDLRIFVVGGRAVAAVRRRPRVGRLTRNLGQGARFEKAAPGGEAEEAAVAAARVVGLEVCAVDMLDAPDGPAVFEVHSSPGIREAEEACGADVAGAIVERAAVVVGAPAVVPRARPVRRRRA